MKVTEKGGRERCKREIRGVNVMGEKRRNIEKSGKMGEEGWGGGGDYYEGRRGGFRGRKGGFGGWWERKRGKLERGGTKDTCRKEVGGWPQCIGNPASQTMRC